MTLLQYAGSRVPASPHANGSLELCGVSQPRVATARVAEPDSEVPQRRSARQQAPRDRSMWRPSEASGTGRATSRETRSDEPAERGDGRHASAEADPTRRA